MKTLTRSVTTLVIMVNVVVVCAVAQPQTKPNKQAPTGKVSGSVTIRGKPAVGLVVRLRSNDSTSSTDSTLKATTNEEGKYQIVNIPPGTYVIAPIAWGFVASEPNSERRNDKSFVIAEDESIENLDFSLVRGGVITGKVTDTNGRPVMEETVNLMLANQGGSFYPGVFFQTDDRGIYRIFGVPVGRFKVSAGQGDDDLNGRSLRSGRIPYRQTFFPDVSDPAKAKVVEVAEETEVTNIDITVGQRVREFSASGRVVDGETGKPVTNITIAMTRTVIIDPRSSSSVGGTAGHSDSQGGFRIENLVPGHYSLSISPSPGSDLRADPVSFDVVDHDETELLIKTTAGASVEGLVVLEGAQNKNLAAMLDQFYLSAYVEGERSNNGSERTSRIATDGRFRIGGLQPGMATFRLGGSNSVRGFVILRVERNGSVQPNGIRIENGEHLTGVRVVVAYGTSTIRGVVKLENGTLPEGGRLSVRLKKPVDARFSEGAGVDSRGHFMIEKLVGGSYELIVYVFDPVSPQSLRTVKQFVNVAEGAEAEVLVTIDLKQNPAPTPRP